ncbi:MAG: type I methionyl aminopeptidase [Firmicutes bacterium]|nr:type I methionyl aminopeptidase [Bacillota bacterium]MDY5676744.1 type I methionyl aminopeptidase [Eubacteriales bacterium]
MIKIKSQEEIDLMREAGRITRDTLKVVEDSIRVGISTKELDKIAFDYIKSQGATPSFKNYCGFPGSICASVNDTIVHGIPSNNIILKEGDIISIDCGAKYKGYHGDAARTFPVGKIDAKVKRLIKVTEQSFFEGIKDLKSGAFVGDISHRIQTFVEKNGYSIVRELVGHGVGSHLHEDPMVPNYGKAGSGPRLNAGAVIAIEPMVNMGDKNVVFMSDGWTCKTKDGLPSAHYENTVLITENGVEILTL